MGLKKERERERGKKNLMTFKGYKVKQCKKHPALGSRNQEYLHRMGSVTYVRRIRSLISTDFTVSQTCKMAARKVNVLLVPFIETKQSNDLILQNDPL